MTPPTSPPHDTFSATEGEGEAVFAGKPVARSSPRKRNDETQDGKTQAKRQKISPEKHSGQSLSPPAVESKVGGSRSKVDKLKDEKQPMVPLQPPPPPRRPVAPPPPPPKGPPSRKLPKPPPPPPPPGTPSTKRPPPPPNQGSTASPKPPPPTKVPAPPPPSKQVHHAKRPPAAPEASPDLQPPDVKPNADAPSTKVPAPPPPSKQTSDVKPNVDLPPVPSKQVHEAKRPPAAPEGSPDLQTPDVKPNVDLPPGWMCVWSKSQKRWYFFNTKNNKSVWQWPPP